MLAGFFAIEGFAFPPSPFVQLAGGVITLLTAPTLVLLFAAILHAAPQEARIYGTLGLSFTLLFAISVSINRFVQLTVVRLSPVGPASSDLARFLPYSTGSIMFALEMLGWGVFSSLAMLSVAPLFRGGGQRRAIRWLLLAYALFSLLSAVGFATNSALTAAGFVAWGPLLFAIALLLTVHFGRSRPLSES